jgi:hypothetical protein
MEVGDRYNRDQKLNAQLGSLVGKDRDDFVRQTKLACTASQKQSQLNRQVGVTDAQIGVYCDCYANAISKTVTVDELRYFALNGKAPASMQEKVDQTAPGCTSQAFRR